MEIRWLVPLVALAGCDRMWRIDHLGAPPEDADVVDGRVDGSVDGPVDGPTDAAPSCPAEYTVSISNSTSRYRHVEVDTPWTSAEAFCEMDAMGFTRHTHLVVLSNETERTGLFARLKVLGLNNNAWIGLSDRKIEGSFKWVTAQAVGVPPNGQTPPWRAGQPDNNALPDPPGQDCVRMISPLEADEGQFDDVECGAQFQFVCECDDFAPAPANF